MRIKLEAVYYSEDDNEPYIRMDMLSRNRLSVLFRLWWIATKWKQTKLTLTVMKAVGKLL